MFSDKPVYPTNQPSVLEPLEPPPKPPDPPWLFPLPQNEATLADQEEITIHILKWKLNLDALQRVCHVRRLRKSMTDSSSLWHTKDPSGTNTGKKLSPHSFQNAVTCLSQREATPSELLCIHGQHSQFNVFHSQKHNHQFNS